MKIVINRCYGGFALSQEAYEYLGAAKNSWYNHHIVNRTDPDLIKCVETLGKRANSKIARLKIVEIPDDVKWKITQDEGLEQIEEIHRVWK